MNENLREMIEETQTEETPQFTDQELDIPNDVVDKVEDPETEEPKIELTTLHEWFYNNSDSLGEDIKPLKLIVAGVDPNEQLLMSVKVAGDETAPDGHPKRRIRIFDDPDRFPVLNLPAMTMNIYNNGFRIINSYDDTTFIKSYGLKAGLISTFCYNINGTLVPFQIVRIKKKDDVVDVPSSNIAYATNKLREDADLESLQLLYKQSSKYVENLTTNQSVVDWLISRQEDIFDINHHVQIDQVIIDILK